jgi:NAD(P)-dependent dehydrogenase (short-subunit alcohol dehydrogenase family)
MSRRFGLDASIAFARLSGDYNPLHIDPVHARRTQFGGSVVHGIHVVLDALDGLCGDALAGGIRPAAISCTFNSPVHTDSAVRVDATPDPGHRRLRLVGEADGRLAFSATIDLEDSRNDIAPPLDDLEFEPASPAVHTPLPPANHAGSVTLRLSRPRLRELFPNLAKSGAPAWVADLLATTRIVGMECPGMHSIYAAFKLQAIAGSANPPAGSMRYAVEKSDSRFRMVRIAVQGGALHGTVEAFVRAPPVHQMSLSEVAAKVVPAAYEGQRALVIGGSRGLGEVTAKILVAGGADVTITYASGREDADRICREVAQSGRRCGMMRLDACVPLDSEAIEKLTAKPFTHVYYFASPHVARNTSGQWDHALFARYSAVYVDAFASISRTMLSRAPRGERPMRFLFPSSVFLDAFERGFDEYCAAKAAGESVCDSLARHHGIVCARPRLPRMRTDQTSGLPDSDTREPFEVMNALLPDFHAGRVDRGA